MGTILFLYFILTGMVSGSYIAAQQEDSDKAVYYFTICFLTGWFTFPIKLVKGFMKTYKEVEREKNAK